MNKRYFRVKDTTYSFRTAVLGKVFEGAQNGMAIQLRIDVPHEGYPVGREWNFSPEDLEEVSASQRARKSKKPVKVKQTPPTPKQRKLHIRYASGKDYHLKNVSGVVVDTRSDELKVTYSEDREGTEFRVNFTVPFADLTAIHFQDKVSKVSVGYFFEDGELAHRVEHFYTKPGVYQH